MDRLFAKTGVPYLLIGLATLAVWAHTISFDFVWDDDFFIRRLPAVRSLTNVPSMFYSIEAQATDPYLFRVFRPIRTAHYALLYTLSGASSFPEPWIFHLANVLWHGVTAMALFGVLKLLFGKVRTGWLSAEPSTWALLAALGFAVHPVVSEVVCWAKSLDDILAAFFTLASLRELLKPADKRTAQWLALIFFALAVYSKESAVPFVILPVFIHRVIHRLSWRECVQRTSLFLVVAAAYIVHRGYIIERNSQANPLSGTYLQTLVDMLPVAAKYCRLMFGVPPFLIDYRFMRGGYGLGSIEALGGIVLLTLLGVGIWLALRNERFKACGYGLLWSGLFLLPVSNLVPMMQYMAERFLYLPLIGWLVAMAAVLAAIPRRALGLFGAVLLLGIWAVTAWQRSWIWKDELTLFVRTYNEGPPVKRVEHNMVSAILHLPWIAASFKFDDETGKLACNFPSDEPARRQVLGTFKEAYRLLPRNHLIISCYGISLASSGRFDLAVRLFEKAVMLKPNNTDYWLNLGRAAMDAGLDEKARRAVAQALVLSPDHTAVLKFAAELEWKIGNLPAAREAVLHWRKLSPSEENADWLRRLDDYLNNQTAVPTNK